MLQEICVINAQSGYSNKTAVIVIISMRSLVSIEQQSPRRPCDILFSLIQFCHCMLKSRQTYVPHFRDTMFNNSCGTLVYLTLIDLYHKNLGRRNQLPPQYDFVNKIIVNTHNSCRIQIKVPFSVM